jgi:hypothetical protein
MGKCVFNRKCLSDDKLQWVTEVKQDKHKAYCKICLKEINLAMMGYSALLMLSHADSISHKELCSRPTQNFAISSFFSNPSISFVSITLGLFIWECNTK